MSLSNAIYFNLEPAAKLILQGLCHHIHIGDSQSSDVFLRWTNHFISYVGKRLHYYVASSSQAGNQCFSNYLPSGTGDFTTTSHTGSSNAYTGLTAANTFFRPALSQAYITNLAVDTVFGSGIFLCRKCNAGADPNSPGNTGGQWPDVDVGLTGFRPWYHNSYMRAKLIVHRVTAANELPSFKMYMLRQGLNNNNSSATQTVTLTGTIVKETGWTAALTDAANYVTANDYGGPNDHEVGVRLLADASTNETNHNLLLLGAVFQRCTSGGVAISDTNPLTGSLYQYGYDFVGVSGRSPAELADSYQPQATWQEYFTRTVLNPEGQTVGIFCLGHNNGSAYDVGTNATDAANKYRDYISKVKAAHDAAFPGGKFIPVVCVPWYSPTESNAMQTVAKASAFNNAVANMARTNGWAFVSFFEYFNRQQPFNQLHPESIAEVHEICRAFRHILDDSTGYAYSSNPTIFAHNNRRRRIVSRL
jgi:hypothetical protein